MDNTSCKYDDIFQVMKVLQLSFLHASLNYGYQEGIPPNVSVSKSYIPCGFSCPVYDYSSDEGKLLEWWDYNSFSILVLPQTKG